jgi:hypothetical protein
MADSPGRSTLLLFQTFDQPAYLGEIAWLRDLRSQPPACACDFCRMKQSFQLPCDRPQPITSERHPHAGPKPLDPGSIVHLIVNERHHELWSPRSQRKGGSADPSVMDYCGRAGQHHFVWHIPRSARREANPVGARQTSPGTGRRPVLENVSSRKKGGGLDSSRAPTGNH